MNGVRLDKLFLHAGGAEGEGLKRMRWGAGGTGLVGPVAFEILDALVEMVVGTADEGVRLLELAIEIFPFLHVLNLDVHGETLGYEVQLVAEAFDQHAAMALGLFDPFIDFIEPPVVCV